MLPAGEGAAGTWNLSLLEGVSAPQLGEDAAVQAGAESPGAAPLRLDGAQWSGAAFYLALLDCAALALRRLRALRRMETCPARAACDHLLRAVRFSGRLRGAQRDVYKRQAGRSKARAIFGEKFFASPFAFEKRMEKNRI